MFDDSGVVVEDLIGVRFRAPGAWHAFYGEQILCGVGNSVQRAAIVAIVNFFLRGLGLRQGNFRSQASVGVVTRAELFAAVEKILRQVHRRKLLRLDAFRKFRDGQESQFFRGHRCPQGFAGASGVFPTRVFSSGFFSRSSSGLRYRPGPSPFSSAWARKRSSGGCARAQSLRRSVFCASEKRLPYWLRMVWTRASTSAWPSGESLGMSPACGGWAGGAAGMAWAAGMASAVAGAMDAAAEAMAARRANSRREIRPGLPEPGLRVSSIKISVCVVRRSKRLPAAGSEEATESGVERQHLGRNGVGKEATLEPQDRRRLH